MLDESRQVVVRTILKLITLTECTVGLRQHTQKRGCGHVSLHVYRSCRSPQARDAKNLRETTDAVGCLRYKIIGGCRRSRAQETNIWVQVWHD